MSKQPKTEKGVRLGMEYEVEVRDKDGKLLSKVKGKSDTWVRNYIRMLRTSMSASDNVNVTVSLLDTGGVSRTYYGSATVGTCTLATGAGAGVDTYGVQVGTSDVAFDRTHYSLQGKISHGSGSGQLLYGVMTVEDYSESDSLASFRLIRAFTNSSGGTVTVKEIGIVIRNHSGASDYMFLIARDVLASPQSIPDGATLTVRYKVYIAYA